MFEAPAIIGICIHCIAPGSLGATLALIGVGAGIARRNRFNPDKALEPIIA